ncbi:MAG TPA: hypothetical protein VIJ12_06645 [Candidatus Baltobacteraceae bacterium]
MSAELIWNQRGCSGVRSFFPTDYGKEFVLKSISIKKSRLIVAAVVGGLQFEGAKSYAIAAAVDGTPPVVVRGDLAIYAQHARHYDIASQAEKGTSRRACGLT